MTMAMRMNVQWIGTLHNNVRTSAATAITHGWAPRIFFDNDDNEYDDNEYDGNDDKKSKSVDTNLYFEGF